MFKYRLQGKMMCHLKKTTKKQQQKNKKNNYITLFWTMERWGWVSAWGMKLLHSLVVWHQILLYLLPHGSRVNRLWLGWVLSLRILFTWECIMTFVIIIIIIIITVIITVTTTTIIIIIIIITYKLLLVFIFRQIPAIVFKWLSDMKICEIKVMN